MRPIAALDTSTPAVLARRPPRRAGRTLVPAVGLALLGLVAPWAVTGCGPAGGPGGAGDEETAAGAARIVNEELGIALARVPDGFEVARNQAAELVLERSAPDQPGRLEVLVGPVQTAGVNLVDQVWEEKTRIESMDGGDYRGQNELAGAAIGTVYTSRGRFIGEDGEAIEELRALAVHPGQNRLLILDYEYPPTEKTGERLTELMGVIEQVEAAGTAPEVGESGADTSSPAPPGP